jgi:hypothetical protein
MRPVRRFALFHLLVNALILWLGYYWLGVGESRTSTLLWSAIVFIVFAALACCSYGAALVYFRVEGNREAKTSWRTTLRNLLPLAAVAVVVVFLYWLLEQWSVYSARPAFRIASWLTLTLRTPVRPTAVARIFNVILWLVRWAALPVLLLPAVSAIAASGWDGFRYKGPLVPGWLYGIEVPLLLLCLIRLPLWLFHWVPAVDGFGMQAASFTVRAAVAYLLFGISWLVLAFVTSGGKPRPTQSSTADSP